MSSAVRSDTGELRLGRLAVVIGAVVVLAVAILVVVLLILAAGDHESCGAMTHRC